MSDNNSVYKKDLHQVSEKLFYKWDRLSHDVRNLGCTVQNGPDIISNNDIKEWAAMYKRIKEDMNVTVEDMKQFFKDVVNERKNNG